MHSAELLYYIFGVSLWALQVASYLYYTFAISIASELLFSDERKKKPNG